jgi:hypothetical protein
LKQVRAEQLEQAIHVLLCDRGCEHCDVVRNCDAFGSQAGEGEFHVRVVASRLLCEARYDRDRAAERTAGVSRHARAHELTVHATHRRKQIVRVVRNAAAHALLRKLAHLCRGKTLSHRHTRAWQSIPTAELELIVGPLADHARRARLHDAAISRFDHLTGTTDREPALGRITEGERTDAPLVAADPQLRAEYSDERKLRIHSVQKARALFA